MQCTCLLGDFGLLAFFGAGAGVFLSFVDPLSLLLFLNNPKLGALGGREDSKAVVIDLYILLRVPF